MTTYKLYYTLILLYRLLTWEPDIMRAKDMREQVVRPALSALAVFDERLGNDGSIQMMMGVAAHESHLGEYLVQVNGPAMGIVQMEDPTHDDVWRYLDLPKNEDLREIVLTFTKAGKAEEMIYDLRYAIVMGRIKLWMVPEAIPDTVEDQAGYWKTHYNTVLGAGTIEKYLSDYEKYIGDR